MAVVPSQDWRCVEEERPRKKPKSLPVEGMVWGAAPRAADKMFVSRLEELTLLQLQQQIQRLVEREKEREKEREQKREKEREQEREQRAAREQREQEEREQRAEEHRLHIQEYDARAKRVVLELQRHQRQQHLKAQDLHRYVQEQQERDQECEQLYLRLEQTLQGMQAYLPAATTRGLAAADVMDMLLKAVDNELLVVTCAALTGGRRAEEFKGLGIRLVEDRITFAEFHYALEKLDKNNKSKGKEPPDWQWLDGLVNQAVSRVESAVDKAVGAKGKGIQLQLRKNLAFFVRAIKPLQISGAHAINLYEHRSVKKSLRAKKVSRRKLALRPITTEEHAIRKEICEELIGWLESGVNLDNRLERLLFEVKEFALMALYWYKECLAQVEVY